MKIPSNTKIQIYLWSGVAVFVAAVVFVASVLVVNTRQKALTESEQQVTRFAAGAEATFNRSLLSIDILLASTDEWLNHVAHIQALNKQEASRQLRNASRQNLLVRYVALLNEKGQTVAYSDDVGELVKLNFPDGFIANVLSQQIPTLKISTPVVSFSSAEQVLYFGRRLQLKDGTVLVAVAEVPVVGLSAVLLTGLDIDGLETTVERLDGQLLFGAPLREARSGTLLDGALHSMAVPENNWSRKTRLTGKLGLVIHRGLLYDDLQVSASIPLEDALVDWRDQRNAIILAAIFFVLMILGAGRLSQGYLDRMLLARHQILESKATLDQALESMESGFLLLDSDTRVVQWNRRLIEIYPCLGNALYQGKPFREVALSKAKYLFPHSTPMHHEQWVNQRLSLQSKMSEPHEQAFEDGRVIQITECVTPEGGVVITYHDVTELRQASAEIENLAFYDPLTNLPNRRLLMDRIQQAMVASVRSNKFGALLFLDLDHFKNLNDSLGHEVGDMLLCEVAQRLKSAVRREDTVARLGGDEFVVMLEDLSADKSSAAALARKIGEKILLKLNIPFALGAHNYHSTPSIGATIMGDGGIQPSADILRQADIAMYQVKTQGRNALCFFDPQMQVVISQRAQLESDLQIALSSNQFESHYQPQFHLNGKIIGAEALIRWRHPERGLIPPGVFIGVAEESELIIPMGNWVLRTACEQLTAWDVEPAFKHVQISVNVSARQFRQHDFVARVIEVLRETGAKPHLLKLELTESLMLDNVKDTIEKIEQLKTKGVRFSVDDFGTGYSSLAYLTQLPLDQLKIDQSFVRNMGVKHTDDVIVQTIIGMAQNLELDVIAEGVETQEQKDCLAEYGCQFFQGYLLAKPAPVSQIEKLLLENLTCLS